MLPPLLARFCGLTLMIQLAVRAASPSNATVEASFATASADFLRFNNNLNPVGAVALGLHEYDGKYVVPTAATNEAVRAGLMGFHKRFSAFDRAQLSPTNLRDLSVIENQIGTKLLFADRLRYLQRSPLAYADQPDVSIYLKRDWKPLNERVRDMTALLRLAPAHFAAAQNNLEARLPRPWIELGIEVAEATASFWEKDVANAAAEVSDPAVRAEFATANTAALQAIRAYTTWLKTERLPQATDDFALGREGFSELLSLEMIHLMPERVLEIARRELKAEQARFADAGRIIDPSKPAPEVFLAIQRDHPTEAGLIPDTRRNLEAIRDFVVDRKLVTIPSPVRAQVKETLPPFRATSFASMDTPGPFETKATEAYYYVTPTEKDWTTDQKNEWLTAFNYYTTDVVSIHEAYPGHYVQFLALNASSVTPAAKVFGSYAFIEGWAHYTEQMVIEAGYAGPEPVKHPPTSDDRLRIARYQMAQSNEALLRIARLCCAIQLHCLGMTVDQATDFFVTEAYYQEKPARSEAQRGTFDPGYGFYTLGKLQLLKLRSDWQAQEGDRFTLQRFHDAVLSHGMPPIRILRELMLTNSASWDDIL
ncbi:MAG TPA: DUF885 domain-containing protein [Verrucomicrobiota bacterium]|nr:hypothetical protein [Verrucomicrobiales bacterium]HRI15595.1 DUF885 domain-containing protein [Verrucomicrobiota bacterium]